MLECTHTGKNWKLFSFSDSGRGPEPVAGDPAVAADTPERWQQIATLFDEALKVPPERRGAFLESACAGDAELRRRVVELLEASGQAAAFLERPVVPGAAAILRRLADEPVPGAGAPESSAPSSPPTRSVATGGEARETIGPYRLLQRIGEGGMGEVWLAEQKEPIHREVALKVIKAGMDTKQVVARFEAERQALALMDHPCIAKVFEAGETPRGLPYFAMEHVPGEPITHYCDRTRLTLQERLALFRQVCEGVQHAHQKGVIHRDLKPSNVLVMTVGNNPVAKIIDFGVAKATAQRLTERTLFTELGVMIGTPEYMSPEQADLTGLDVDTRTDVYALGVMLYELLTGVLPFEPKELRQAGFEEIRRRIREVDPPRPSTRLRALGARSTEAAQRRRTEPRKLVSRLKGDLDWIVMKAMEKDRTRRYGSAADLGAEVGRHVNNEPVLAGPPGASYRARKFVRRHRFGVGACVAGVAGLVAFAASMAVQVRRTERERARAEQESQRADRVSGFLTNLFVEADPWRTRRQDTTVREVLDRGAVKIDRELAGEPLVQAQLMYTMGWVYLQLGLLDKAEPLILRSLELRRRLLGDEHKDTLASKYVLGILREYQGRSSEAETIYREVLEARRRVLGEDHPDTIWSLQNVGAILMIEGRYVEAEKPIREAIEKARRVLGEDHYATLWYEGNLGNVLSGESRHEEALRLFRYVLDRRRRILGADDPTTLSTMKKLAGEMIYEGHPAEAEKILRDALDTQRRVLGRDHMHTLDTMGWLAVAISRQGRYDEAEGLAREVSERARRSLGEHSPSTNGTWYNLSCHAALHGERTRALDWLREAVDHGFRDADMMSTDEDLRSLRGDPGFETLIERARKKRPEHP